MRERPQRWLSWRVAPAGRPTRPEDRPTGGRFGGVELAPYDGTVTQPQPTPDSLAELKADTPGPDGIRRRLVEKVRGLIADGAYDTPERWAAAEERFFHRTADGK